MSTWAETFRALRGGLSQEQAAALLSGRTAADALSVRVVQEWEQGRRAPPGWVQHLIAGQLLRQKILKPNSKTANQ